MTDADDYSPERILADADRSMLASAFAYIDEGGAEKAAQFEEILVGSPEARDQYIAFCLQSIMLSEELLCQQEVRLSSSSEDVAGMAGTHDSFLEPGELWPVSSGGGGSSAAGSRVAKKTATPVAPKPEL